MNCFMFSGPTNLGSLLDLNSSDNYIFNKETMKLNKKFLSFFSPLFVDIIKKILNDRF